MSDLVMGGLRPHDVVCSAFMLVKHATNVKQEMTGIEFLSGRNLRRPLYWDLRPVRPLPLHLHSNLTLLVGKGFRQLRPPAVRISREGSTQPTGISLLRAFEHIFPRSPPTDI